MSSFPNDPFLIYKRKGDKTDPFLQYYEPKTVSNGKVILTELPDKGNHVNVDDGTNTYAEITSQASLSSSNVYYVDYDRGIVYFDASKEGLKLNFKYLGIGGSYVPATRVYTQSANGTVTQDVQDMIDNYNQLNGTDLYRLFDPQTGHKHTGASGDAPPIDSQYVNYSGNGVVSTSNVKDTLDSHAAQLADNAIDVCNPAFGLSAVKADGSDPLGDTNRLQTIVNYAIANKKDVYVPKDLILQPIAQTDGSLVCITFDDGNASTGNSRTSFRMYAKKGVQISTNNTTTPHTIFRWKLGDSSLDGFQFVGTKAYTIGLELSRINQKDTTESDTTSRNRFANLRFISCNHAITLEGSCYYNIFDTVTFYNSNLCLWLKVTYAMINGLLSSGTVDSNVNRNNFYNLSAYGCTNGILLDYGDTNKFYSCSFEWLSGTAIQVNDQMATYTNAYETQFNGFYGITNEQNGTDLLYNNPHEADNFIDFDSSATKCTFNYRPSTFIPSGDHYANNLFFEFLTMTSSNVLQYLANRLYSEYPIYATDIADYVGKDASGYLKGQSWRNFNFTTAQCTNVATLQFNSGTTQALYKSLGGIVHYFAKFNITATTATSSIGIPLPSLQPDTNTFGFGNTIPGAITVGYVPGQGNGIPQVLPAILDADNSKITIQPPSGGWSTSTSASANVITINLNYPRQGAVNLFDTN